MENIMDHLKLVETKQENLHKLFDQAQAQAQASSILLLTRQWEDLVSHFELTKGSLLKQAQVLVLREKKMVETMKLLEQRDKEMEINFKRIEDRFDELRMKEKQVDLLKKWTEECNLELTSKEKQLNLCRKEVEEYNEKLSLNKEQLGLVQRQLEECYKELSGKKEHLGVVQQSIQDCAGELEFKERKLDLVEKMLEECTMKFNVKKGQLNSVQKSLEEHSEQLESKKEEAEKLADWVTNCKGELELKEEELHKVKNLIIDSNTELELKEKKLELLQGLTKNWCFALDLKMKEMDEIQKSIEECLKELDLKKKELDGTQKLIEEHLKLLDLKENELNVMQKSIEESSKDLDLKKKHLDSIKLLIEEKTEELAVKQKQHDAIKKCKDEHAAEVKSKEKKFNEIQKSSEDQNKDFKSKENIPKSLKIAIKKHGRELQAMKEQQTSIQKSIVKSSKELELKEKNLDSARKSLKERWDELQSKEAELCSVKRTSSELFKELDEKKKHFDSLNNELQERSKKLEMKEKQFEGRVKEFELKVQQFDSMHRHQRQAPELGQASEIANNLPGRNMLSLQVKAEQMEGLQVNDPIHSSENFQSSAASGERSSQLVLNECVGELDSMYCKVSAALQMLPDPAKFVLDVMQGSYSLHRNHEVMGFDASVMRSKVLILEQLMIVSPKISPQVKQAAIKLAVTWKEKTSLEARDSAEVLAFLLFLSVYGLVSYFSKDEISPLIWTVAHHKQAPKICQTLGCTDMMPGFIHNLIQRKQYMEAARFSCTFGLVDRFPPELVLKEYLENTRMDALMPRMEKNSPEAQCQAIDKEIAVLRATLECIADCKLESRFVTENIVHRIVKLEKKKADSRYSLSAPASIVQLQQQGREYNSIGGSVPRDQLASAPSVQQQLQDRNLQDQLQPQSKNKRPKVDVLADRPYPLQVTTPINLHMNRSAQQHGSGVAAYRHPTHFG